MIDVAHQRAALAKADGDVVAVPKMQYAALLDEVEARQNEKRFYRNLRGLMEFATGPAAAIMTGAPA